MTSNTHTPGFRQIMRTRILRDITDNRLACASNANRRDMNASLLKLFTKYPPHKSEVTNQTTKLITHQDIVHEKLEKELQDLQYEYGELAARWYPNADIIGRAYNAAYRTPAPDMDTRATNIFTRIGKMVKNRCK